MNIENKKQMITLLLAIALGLVAALLTSFYIKGSIQDGIELQSQQYKKEINQALAKELQKKQGQINQLKKNQDRLAKQLRERPKVVAPVKEVKTTPKIDSNMFSPPPGKRAVTLSIPSLSAVGGLINPGDYVDVIAHVKVPAGPKKTRSITTVLFQDIQVLAVGTKFKTLENPLAYASQQKSSKLKITLAVTPEEASLLSFVEPRAKLQLSLRSQVEQGKMPLEIASWDALADYVRRHQGTEILPPKKEKEEEPSENEKEPQEEKPFIQIFRRGQEL